MNRSKLKRSSEANYQLLTPDKLLAFASQIQRVENQSQAFKKHESQRKVSVASLHRLATDGFVEVPEIEEAEPQAQVFLFQNAKGEDT